MKRANQLLERVADPDNLRLAFWKARKGKSYSNGVQAFRDDLESNLAGLRRQIISGEVIVGDYRYFKVFEPKERKICASAFREQVLHHALMNCCHEFFERVQIFDSYASRKGKGTYAALGRAKLFTNQYAWYLKLDVRKFFESIAHKVLKEQLERLFKDYRVLDLFGKIIDSYEALPGRGLPIGNLTSQYFANHYLTGLDHFIKEQLRCKAYVRYMDDMVLWSADKGSLKDALREIDDFVRNRLDCELKPALLSKTIHGAPFLGYRILPHNLRLLQNSKRRFVRKLAVIEAHYQSGTWSETACQRQVLPLLAFIRHADSKYLRNNVLLRLKGLSS